MINVELAKPATGRRGGNDGGGRTSTFRKNGSNGLCRSKASGGGEEEQQRRSSFCFCEAQHDVKPLLKMDVWASGQKQCKARGLSSCPLQAQTRSVSQAHRYKRYIRKEAKLVCTGAFGAANRYPGALRLDPHALAIFSLLFEPMQPQDLYRTRFQWRSVCAIQLQVSLPVNSLHRSAIESSRSEAKVGLLLGTSKG